MMHTFWPWRLIFCVSAKKKKKKVSSFPILMAWRLHEELATLASYFCVLCHLSVSSVTSSLDPQTTSIGKTHPSALYLRRKTVCKSTSCKNDCEGREVGCFGLVKGLCEKVTHGQTWKLDCVSSFLLGHSMLYTYEFSSPHAVYFLLPFQLVLSVWALGGREMCLACLSHPSAELIFPSDILVSS